MVKQVSDQNDITNVEIPISFGLNILLKVSCQLWTSKSCLLVIILGSSEIQEAVSEWCKDCQHNFGYCCIDLNHAMPFASSSFAVRDLVAES